MRIISGTAKGTKLETLEGENTRPTLDRVKEALFSIIQNDLIEANILDLFAGSGALGLESLSRGADKVTFCDKEYKAIKIIKQNIIKTKFENQSKIINKDYVKCLEELKNEKFDIVFLDPPYKKGLVKNAVEKIIEFDMLTDNGIVIIETDEEKTILEQLESINANVYDLRKYGRVKLIFLNRKG